MAKKILILRFSSIGDIVLTTPVIRVLREQLGAEVHFLTKRKYAATLEANPYLTRLWSFDKEITEVLPALRAEHFDTLIDLHVNLRSWRLRWALQFPTTYSFDKLNWQKYLLTRFKIDRLPRIHIVDRYLAAAAPLGISNDGKGLDYFIPPEQEVTVPIPAGYPPAFVALVIGAAHATKRLPPDKLVELARALRQPVCLLGGPEEAAQGEDIARLAGPHVVNLCGQLNLHGSASVIRQAERVITPDTGMMHIAAALQKPITSVWGNTVPAFGMYPYYGSRPDRNHTVEIKGLACRPCSKIGYAQCPQGHFKCMRDIEVTDFFTPPHHK